MHRKNFAQSSVSLLFYMFTLLTFGQEGNKMVWYDASDLTIHGKSDSYKLSSFYRFPMNMKERVRSRVWQLSRNSSGLYLSFQSNATEIVIRYQVEDEYAFPHMPATGVSGLDLYARENDKWEWVRGNFNFKDTISYRFAGMKQGTQKLRTFRLYLPLYNTVKWMKVGIPEVGKFNPIDMSDKKPVVIYGTSIAQGACASRPGLAWTNILGRKLAWPIINLGFSGNGRLEEEIIDYIKKKQASVYVLDCMANFTPGQGLNPEVAEHRIIKAVKSLGQERPDIPILLVEHAGYSDGEMQPSRKKVYLELNEATQRAYSKLKANNESLLYILTLDEIGLNQNSFVDGTHPNDLGMQQYADAILKKLNEITDIEINLMD